MYGLSQSGYIANQDIIKQLKPHGYYPLKRTPRLWVHKTRPIIFTLVVDDFDVKYMNKTDTNNLFHIIRKKYLVRIDQNGSKYLGINLDWYYDEGYVILLMKGYVKKELRVQKQDYI